MKQTTYRATEGIGTALAALARVVLRVPRLTILLGLVAGGLSLYYALSNLGINTDTADMISPQLSWRQDFIDFRDSFTVRNRNIVMVVDAAIPERANALATSLVERLRSRPELFNSVFLAGEGEFFERNGLLFLSVEELQALGDRLAEAQPLLGRMRQRFDGVQLLGMVGEVTSRGEDERLGPVYGALTAALDAAIVGQSHPVSWQQILQADASSGARRYVVLQSMQDFTRIQPAAAAMSAVRSFIDELDLDGGTERVRVTGTVAMEHEELVSVTRGAGLAGVAALLLVACVLYVALRSAILLIVSVLTLLVGLSGTAAFAAAAVGHLNLLSVAFAVLYIGLGVDFILHVCLRLKELMIAGKPKDLAIVETMRGVGGSLVICAVTTAAGFYSFIPTPFTGVSELGLIAGTGMFVSLLVSVTLLPALLAQFYSASDAGRQVRWLGARVLDPLTARPRLVIGGAAIAAIGVVFSLPWLSFDSNPVNLRDPTTESVAVLQELAEDGEALPMNLVAIAQDRTIAAAWIAELSGLDAVKSAQSLDSLVPDDQEEKVFILEDIDLILGPGFAQVTRVQPEPSEFLAALRELADVLGRDELRSDDGAVLESSILVYLDALGDPGRQPLSPEDLERSLLQTLPDQLRRLAAGLAARPFGRDALPVELAARWVTGDGRELVEIVPAENMNDNVSAGLFVDSVRERVPSATGLPVVHREAGRTVVQAFQLAFIYALIMVSVILWVFLRDLRNSILVIVPVVLAAGVTAALAVVVGLEFNFANIIALPLLLGVGVDNGIHMVHRARTETPRDGSVIETSTSRAVLASGLTTVASFGNLAFASHLGMASMGKLLTLGMVVTLAATLILLPALLKLRAES